MERLSHPGGFGSTRALRTRPAMHPGPGAAVYGCRVADPVQPPFGSREERVAYNEDWSRRMNERKAMWIDNGFMAAGFRCECHKANCGVRIRLSGAEWRKVRSEPSRFAVAPDHVDPEVECVVDEYLHFWIVDKKGEAGEAAERLA